MSGFEPGQDGATFALLGDSEDWKEFSDFYQKALEGGLQDSISRVSGHLFSELRGLAGRHAGAIVDVRGAGLLAGIELTRDATDVVAAALDKGLLVNRTATSVVRLLPPYIVTERDVDEAIGILDAVL